jgi:S1-C subfamily serine protease
LEILPARLNYSNAFIYTERFSLLPRHISSHNFKTLMKTINKIFAASILILLSAFVSAQDVSAQTVSALQQQLAIAQDVSTAVVRVNEYKNVPVYAVVYKVDGRDIKVVKEQTGTVFQNISSGTAFFVTSNGYLITNNHVVSDNESVYTVLNNEQEEVVATVVYRDAEKDLALLKVDGENYPYIPIAKDVAARKSSNIITIGNALGEFMDSVSMGKITGTNKTITAYQGNDRDGEVLANLIQTNAKVYPGDSGGPLLNERGELIGVTVATALGKNVGYAIPVSEVVTLLQKQNVIK